MHLPDEENPPEVEDLTRKAGRTLLFARGLRSEI